MVGPALAIVALVALLVLVIAIAFRLLVRRSGRLTPLSIGGGGQLPRRDAAPSLTVADKVSTADKAGAGKDNTTGEAGGLGPGITPHLSAAAAAAARERFVASAPTLPAPGPQNGPTLLFWNVHEYVDPLGAQRGGEIAALIARARADCVALAEAAPASSARAAMADYPNQLTTPNGGTLLALGWRGEAGTARVVPTTGSRNCILYEPRGGPRVAVVHLEIGTRPAPDAGATPAAAARNRGIRRANARRRVKQLAALIAHDPDALVGDFNFELGGDEDAWLAAHGYRPVNGATPLSTPFNRVDHCYVRDAQKYPPESNRLLGAALSDHRPMIQQL